MYRDSSSTRGNTSSDAVLKRILAETGIRRPDLRLNIQNQQSNPSCSACRPSGCNNCDCVHSCQKSENGLTDRSLGMVYSPIQCWTQIYDNEAGFSRGTIFKELDLPFTANSFTKGGGGCRE